MVRLSINEESVYRPFSPGYKIFSIPKSVITSQFNLIKLSLLCNNPYTYVKPILQKSLLLSFMTFKHVYFNGNLNSVYFYTVAGTLEEAKEAQC